jgi:hypothetical protein
MSFFESLKAAYRRAHIVKPDDANANANDDDTSKADALDIAAATAPVYLEIPRFHDVDEGKSDTDVPIGPVNPVEVCNTVDNTMTNAHKDRLSDAGSAKLQALAVLLELSLIAFSTQLGPDPPIDTEPVRITVDPAISQWAQ